jgi:ABC-type multidrug transport system fused ATPase/permease subunit
MKASQAEVLATEAMVNTLRRLYRHFPSRRRVQLVLVLALMLIGALAELVTIGMVLPFLTLITDSGGTRTVPFLPDLLHAVGVDRGNLLFATAVLFAVVAIVAAGMRVLLTWAMQRFVYRLGHDLSAEVYRRTLYQPYCYHISQNSSTLIANIAKVQFIVSGVLLALMQAATGLVISFAIMIGLLLIDARTALLAAFGLGGTYVAVTLATRRRIATNGRVASAAQVERIKSVQEGLGGIRDVILDRTQEEFLRTFARADSTVANVHAYSTFIGAAPRFVLEAAGMVLIAMLAVLLNSAGGIATALPVLGALALGAQRLLPLVQLLYNGWLQGSANRHNLLDVLEVLDQPLPDAQGTPTSGPLAFQREISLEGVEFRYHANGPPVLSDVSLRILRGSRVGIVGKTGSGKSTLMDLIMGLLTPTHGLIRVDGEVLTAANMARWHAHIAHVPQSIYLSDCSIAENIAFGIPVAEIDHARVRDAARQAVISDFIEGLPDGYATLVGERGVRLSGGQRQRIGIARALYKEVALLILDEATNALDSATEAAVLHAITALGSNVTIVVIAHRASALEACQRIVKLESGQLIADASNNQGVRELSAALLP